MTELINLELINPNPWNPNVMQKEEYEALLQDMHTHGVNGIDPLLVSPWQVWNGKTGVSNQYIIVDGEHRYKIAKSLAWTKIRCEVQNMTEEEAKALCYRRNRERGTLDPFKEALLFKSEENMTQAQIAGKYGIEQGTVSQRLSLLKLDSEIIEKARTIPHGIIGPSHLEPIATLEPKDQKIVVDSMVREAKMRDGEAWSVRTVQDTVQRLKKQRTEEKALAKALETAKYPKCPKCKKPPERINYKGLPWVNCPQFHPAWNLNTGRGEYERETRIEKNLEGKEKRVIVPSTIRSAHTLKEIHQTFVDRIKEVIPNLDIADIRVTGKLYPDGVSDKGVTFRFDLDCYNKVLSVSWTQGSMSEGFHAEEHDYRTGEKTRISAGVPAKVEATKDLIENAFQGKLGIESKRLKKASKEVSEDKEPLEAENIAVTRDPAKSLATEKLK